jgi:hypothetical protein
LKPSNIIAAKIYFSKYIHESSTGGILPGDVMGAKGPIRVKNSIGMVTI